MLLNTLGVNQIEMKEFYCTYSDKNYLLQLVTLLNSMNDKLIHDFACYVLCFDEVTFCTLNELKIKNIIPISSQDFLNKNPRQKITLSNRNFVNYFYSCTPVIIRNVLEDNNTSAKRVTYLDADLWFFADIEEYLREIQGYDVAIIKHSYKKTKDVSHGIFNVGILTFTNSPNGIECLTWWEKKTFENTEYGDSVWGDQKYLDEFPKMFKNVKIVQNYGISAAPWNINHYKFNYDNESKRILLDEQYNLIIYHFARLIYINKYCFIPARRSEIKSDVLEHVYLPYFMALRSTNIILKKINPEFKVRYTSHNLRGLILGILAGRAFCFIWGKVIRIGIHIKYWYEES